MIKGLDQLAVAEVVVAVGAPDGEVGLGAVGHFVAACVNKGLMAKPHTERFTGMTVYRYNWPREGSLCWLGSKGLIK